MELIELVEKNIQKVQLCDISLEFLCRFYEEEANKNTVILLYDGEDYFTNIAYEEILGYGNDRDLVYFIKYLCKEKSVKDDLHAYNSAEILFDKNPYISFVLLEKEYSANDKKALFYSNIIFLKEDYRENLKHLKYVLGEKGVHTYFVKIPDIDDISEELRHPEWKWGCLTSKLNWAEARKCKMKLYLNRFTDLEYDDAKESIQKSHVIYESGGGERTIFLVGPCIVGGWEGFPDDGLSDVLYERLSYLGLPYKIVNIVNMMRPGSKVNDILEYDIRQNDIVLFLNSVVNNVEKDLDLAYAFNSYRGKKWLYSDIPIHTTRTGNEIIADTLIEKIILPVTKTFESKFDQNILHRAEKQLTYEELEALQQYLANIVSHNKGHGTIGACVMTCNPFTKGHQYLIEYASRQVDFLYIFIVEEDAVLFPFEDRIKMVRSGVKDLKNVAVFPSGKFMISKFTFKNYFEKEEVSDITIDAAKDTMIFKEYIVPTLRISKRFVGEEPDDNITNQYNQLLKRDLSGIVDVIEIPRRKVNEEIISASKVRSFIKEEKWNEIEKMVPQSTLEFIRHNIEKIYREKNGNESLDRIMKFIQDHSKIIICGLGGDAKNLMWRLDFQLDKKDIEKLEFYDQMASKFDYSYRGKKIICFEELVNKYNNYFMLITSSIYKKDIFYSLVKNGIQSNHIMIACENI